MSKKSYVFVAVALGFSVCATMPLLAQRGRTAPTDLPDGACKQTVQTVCASCHTLDYITRGWGYDKKGWDELIATMIALPPDTENNLNMPRLGLPINANDLLAKTDKFLVGVSLPDCAAPCTFGAERCRSARGEPTVISNRGRGGRCPGYPSEGRRDPSDRWFRRRTGKRSSAAWP